MMTSSKVRWRKPRLYWPHVLIFLFNGFLIHCTGAGDKTKLQILEQNDALVIEVGASNNDASIDPDNEREKRQLFPGFGAGVFPPGWPFVHGMNRPVSVSPQFPQFPQFPGISINHLQPLQPTQPPTPAAPQPTAPPLGSLGSCLTNNGLTGYCASFRQCYPILYSPDDGHIMNNGLAEMYMNNSGPCNGHDTHSFLFRTDAQLRQNQICCGSSIASQPTFPSFGFPPLNIFHQITMRPPWAQTQRPTTTSTTTTTTRPTPPHWSQWTQRTTSTTTRPTTTTPYWAHWTQPSTTTRTTPPHWAQWTQTTTTRQPQNIWQTSTAPTQAPPRPSTTTTSPVTSSCGVGKIVGGSQAVKGEFPWLVALVRNSRQVCGGTLIDSQYILTAAHCFNGVTAHELQTLFKVYIGDYDLHTLSDGPMTVKSISKLIIHRQFHQQYFYNDIALLKLDSPVQFGSNGNNDIRPICISGGGSYEGQPAVVAGWGRTSAQNTYQPGIYRKVDLKVWNLQQCAATYGQHAPGGITSQMMCAGVTNKDSCLGDSGGPLMRKVGNVWEQIGIVSWGIGCGQYPGVYTRVADYSDWISRHRQS